MQTLGLAELVAQLQAIRSRWSAGEDVVGDGTERKDIEVLADIVVIGNDFGSHVRRTGIVNQSLDVRSRRDHSRRVGCRRPFGSVTNLPIEDFDLISSAFLGCDQNALRAE